MDPATAALNWPPSKQRINLVSAKRCSLWTGFLGGGQGETACAYGNDDRGPCSKATQRVARNPNDANSWLFFPSLCSDNLCATLL